MARIDSNSTGLRIAEEEPGSIGVLPVTPVWIPFEPNSYADFGGNVGTVARRPIEPGRQLRKGTAVSLDASGGFNIDLTQDNMTDFLQGLMFADIEEPESFSAVTNVDGTANEYDAASGLAFLVGDLIWATGFADAANNGLKRVTSVTAATNIGVAEDLVDDASPDAGHQLLLVGFQFAAGDLDVDASGTLPALVSTAKDLTQMGWQPGEWLFVGGDAAGLRFATAANRGFIRLRSITATRAEFDLADSTWVTEASTTETVQVFHGRVLHNQAAAADQVRRTYQAERSLGDDGVGTQGEYLVGQVFGQGVFNFPLEDKVNIDVTLTGLDHEVVNGTTGPKSGTRPDLSSGEAFNTASDIEYRMAVFTEGTEAPTPLFTYIKELTLTVNNNVSPVKALGVLGAVDVTAGAFQVSGSLTAIFEEVAAVQAVRDVADVCLNWRLVRENAGIHFDLPLLTLGESRITVEQDTEVTLPIGADAATGASINDALDHTLMITFFPYLPTLAE